MKNIELKAVSLVSACILAFLVRTVLAPVDVGTSVLQLVLPVEVKNLPANMTIIEPQVRQVEVTLQGQSTVLAKVAAAPPVYKIELPQNLDGQVDIPVSNSQFALPDGISVVGVRPSAFHFTFDEIASVDVPVFINKVGTVNENFVLKSLIADPASVRIRGPKQQVQKVATVQTEVFDISGLSSNYSKEVFLKPLTNPQVQIEMQSVQLSAVVEPVIVSWTLKGISVGAEDASTARFQPDVVSATVSGTKEVKQSLDSKTLKAVVAVRPGETTKQTPHLTGLPEGVVIKSIDEVLVSAITPTPIPANTLPVGAPKKVSAVKPVTETRKK